MIQPLPWQSRPIEVLSAAIRAGSSCLDASETGTGKTFSALLAAKQTGARLGVVCPRSVIPAWTEAAEAVGVDLTFCSNIEQLKTDKHFWLDRTRGDNWRWRVPDDTVLVFDEVHGFAGAETENGLLLGCAPRPTIMLSATAADSPIRMRGIAHQLGICHWQDWRTWCLRHGCTPHFRRKGLVFDGGNDHLLPIHHAIFDTGKGVRVRIADLGDAFPPETFRTVNIPVEDPDTLEGEYAEELRKLAGRAETPMAVCTRARQLAELAKVPAIIELAQNLVAEGRSVAIFVNFRDSAERISTALKCPKVDGDTPDALREAHRHGFQHNKFFQLVCTGAAGGQSWSLHDILGVRKVSSLISPGWSARELLQIRGRCWRATGKSHVDQMVLFAANVPIEQAVRRALDRKRGCLSTLNDGDLQFSA